MSWLASLFTQRVSAENERLRMRVRDLTAERDAALTRADEAEARQAENDAVALRARLDLRARLSRALSSLASMREWHATYHGQDPCLLCLDADGCLTREGVPPPSSSSTTGEETRADYFEIDGKRQAFCAETATGYSAVPCHRPMPCPEHAPAPVPPETAPAPSETPRGDGTKRWDHPAMRAVEAALDAALSEVRRQGGADYLLREARTDGINEGARRLGRPVHTIDGPAPAPKDPQ